MLEELEPPKNKAVYCKVSDSLDNLDEQDRLILKRALADTDSWPAKTLSTALRSRGLSLADTTIAKHRNKTCACFR